MLHHLRRACRRPLRRLSTAAQSATLRQKPQQCRTNIPSSQQNSRGNFVVSQSTSSQTANSSSGLVSASKPSSCNSYPPFSNIAPSCHCAEYSEPKQRVLHEECPQQTDEQRGEMSLLSLCGCVIVWRKRAIQKFHRVDTTWVGSFQTLPFRKKKTLFSNCRSVTASCCQYFTNEFSITTMHGFLG